MDITIDTGSEDARRGHERARELVSARLYVGDVKTAGDPAFQEFVRALNRVASEVLGDPTQTAYLLAGLALIGSLAAQMAAMFWRMLDDEVPAAGVMSLSATDEERQRVMQTIAQFLGDRPGM